VTGKAVTKGSAPLLGVSYRPDAVHSDAAYSWDTEGRMPSIDYRPWRGPCTLTTPRGELPG